MWLVLQLAALSSQFASAGSKLDSLSPVVTAVDTGLRDALRKLFPEPVTSLPIDVRISSSVKSSLCMSLTDDPEVRIAV